MKKKLSVFFLFTAVLLIVFFALRSASQQQLFKKRAAGEPVVLSVTNEITGKTSNKVLGQSVLMNQISNSSDFDSLVNILKPGTIRYPSFLYFYDNTYSSNDWSAPLTSGKNVNAEITSDNKLHFTADKPGRLYQKIDINRFQPGEEYKFRVEYRASNIHCGYSDRGVECGNRFYFKGLFAQLYFYGSSGNLSMPLIRSSIPLGDSLDELSGTFTFPTDASRTPAYVLLELWFDPKPEANATGEVWFDNAEISLNSPGSPNLVIDPSFDNVKLSPTEEPYKSICDRNAVNRASCGLRISNRDIDQIIGYYKRLGAEPVWQTLGFNNLNPGKTYELTRDSKYDITNPNSPNFFANFERAVLDHPDLDNLIEMDVNILRYTNTGGPANPNYIKYWEIGSEPELIYYWVFRLGGYNFGWRADRVEARYKLYGKLYGKIAQRLKAVDPNIKIAAPIFWRVFYKPSIDGFFQGIKELEEISCPPDNPHCIPLPDYWSAHNYQLSTMIKEKSGTLVCMCPNVRDSCGLTIAGITPTPIPEEGRAKICLDNLFSYGDVQVDPNDQTNLIIPEEHDHDYIGYFLPYYIASKNYLNRKLNEHFTTSSVAYPVEFMGTEWEISGSHDLTSGRFGSEVWNADRVGRMTKAGITFSHHWNIGANMFNGLSYQVNSPFTAFALYAKLLDANQTNVLNTTSSQDSQVAIYAFNKDSESPLNLVMVNLIKEDGNTPVQLVLPSKYRNSSVKQYRLTCSGENCLYEKEKTLVNDRPVPFYPPQQVTQFFSEVTPETVAIDTSPYSLNIPNHSVYFWELSPVEVPTEIPTTIPTLTPTNTPIPTNTPVPTLTPIPSLPPELTPTLIPLPTIPVKDRFYTFINYVIDKQTKAGVGGVTLELYYSDQWFPFPNSDSRSIKGPIASCISQATGGPLNEKGYCLLTTARHHPYFFIKQIPPEGKTADSTACDCKYALRFCSSPVPDCKTSAPNFLRRYFGNPNPKTKGYYGGNVFFVNQ